MTFTIKKGLALQLLEELATLKHGAIGVSEAIASANRALNIASDLATLVLKLEEDSGEPNSQKELVA